jgi:hypothetical protein
MASGSCGSGARSWSSLRAPRTLAACGRAPSECPLHRVSAGRNRRRRDHDACTPARPQDPHWRPHAGHGLLQRPLEPRRGSGRSSQWPVSVPLTQHGAVYLDERQKTREMIMILVLAGQLAEKGVSRASPPLSSCSPVGLGWRATSSRCRVQPRRRRRRRSATGATPPSTSHWSRCPAPGAGCLWNTRATSCIRTSPVHLRRLRVGRAVSALDNLSFRCNLVPMTGTAYQRKRLA